jgi:hypothetical protein
LADALVPQTVDELTEPQSFGDEMTEPQPPVLAGTIDGLRWWVDTRPTPSSGAESTLSLVLNGRVQGSGGGPAPGIGLGDVGLPGHGRVYFGRTAADLGSIRVVLSDDTTVTLPVARDGSGTTLFAVPRPIGLDIVSIDYMASDGSILRSRRTPPLTDGSGMGWNASDPL